MAKLFLRHTQTGKRWQVLSLDKEKGIVTLKGETATFEEPFDKERLKKLGYVLEQEPD